MRAASFVAVILVGTAAACAGGPRASTGVTPLTSVDTAWYAVPGSSRAEWAVNLPRAAAAAGIPGGGPSWTVGNVLYRTARTRTTATGCEVDGSLVLLRLGHVMPRLAPDAHPNEAERVAWDRFMQQLWEVAREREAIGAKVADELRADIKRTRTSQCSELLVQNRHKLDGFSARYAQALREFDAERRASGAWASSRMGAPDTP